MLVLSEQIGLISIRGIQDSTARNDAHKERRVSQKEAKNLQERTGLFGAGACL